MPRGAVVLVSALATPTALVAVDGRGGRPAVLRFTGEVDGLSMQRGAGGDAEPQLTLTACRAVKDCRAIVITLTPAAPVRVTARLTGRAAAAATGTDSGRSV